MKLLKISQRSQCLSRISMRKFKIVIDLEYDHDVTTDDVDRVFINAAMKEVRTGITITKTHVHRRNNKQASKSNKNQLGLF